MANVPLIVIGLDAGDPHWIRKWSDEGHLPAIKKLLDAGCYGTTSGNELVSEHGVWVSLFSGISRGQHGYYYFRQLTPGAYALREATGDELDAPPFWSATATEGLKVLAVDIPDMPPVPGISGIQLSNWAVHLGWVSAHAAHQPRAIPPSFLSEADRRFGPRDLILENSVTTLKADEDIFHRLMAQVERRGKLLADVYREQSGGFDLVVTVFAESHTAAHQFWKYRSGASGSDAEPGTSMEHAIRSIYINIDKQIDRLVMAVGSDCNVVLCSTVGVSDYHPSGKLAENFMRLLGYQATPPAQKIPLRPIDIARRLLPEWVRIALSKNFSREARERLLSDQWRNRTDWPRTRAFAVPGTYTSFIQINLKGREAQGIVEPGEEYDKLLDEIEAELARLIDSQTGKSPVEAVVRSTKAFNLARPPASLPDLFVLWKGTDHFLDRIHHPAGELVQERPEWYRPSDHYRQGFFAASGPDVEPRGDIGAVDVLDVAPTLLALLGRRAPERMTGKSALPTRDVLNL